MLGLFLTTTLIMYTVIFRGSYDTICVKFHFALHIV